MEHWDLDLLATRIANGITSEDRVFGRDQQKVKNILQEYVEENRIAVGDFWCIEHRCNCDRMMTGFQWRTITYSCKTCSLIGNYWRTEHQWHVLALT